MIRTVAALAAGAAVLYAAKEALASSGGAGGGLAPGASPFTPSCAPDGPRTAAHRAAGPVMARAVARVLGAPGTAPERQYAQAVAFLETSYGKGWSAESGMAQCNNWGAVQCRETNETPECHQWQDSHSSGEKYKVGFRCYGSPEDGAADVAKHVLVHRPLTRKALLSSGATAFRASYAMRREKYYGGFCPKATSRYGSEPAKNSLAYPDRDEGTRACAREAIELHAKRAYSLMVEIACALGEKVIPLGTYEDAEAWYRSVAK